jgi:nucleoside-diphosphate-sugar epimerase
MVSPDGVAGGNGSVRLPSAGALEGREVLVTGATGLLGSCLAARLLAEGVRLRAVSRDASGGRTTRAIARAARGLGLALPAARLAARLRVIPGSLDGLDALGDDVFQGLSLAWHLAADLRYRRDRLEQVLRRNVDASVHLQERLARGSPDARAFVFTSSAYAFDVDHVPEAIVRAAPPENAYQLSKCRAEEALAVRANAGDGPPLAIVRPSIVVGARGTGFYPGRSLGLYMFTDLGAAFGRIGVTEGRVSLDPDRTLNLIALDVAIAAMASLTTDLLDTQPDGAPRVTVTNVVGHPVRVADVTWAFERATGIRVRHARPRTLIDHLYDLGVAENKPFARGAPHFETTGMERLGVVPPSLTAEELGAILAARVRDGRRVPRLPVRYRRLSALVPPFLAAPVARHLWTRFEQAAR